VSAQYQTGSFKRDTKGGKVQPCRLTLVSLLLDLDLLGQILVLLPLDLVANSLVVDKVTAVANLFLQMDGA